MRDTKRYSTPDGTVYLRRSQTSGNWQPGIKRDGQLVWLGVWGNREACLDYGRTTLAYEANRNKGA